MGAKEKGIHKKNYNSERFIRYKMSQVSIHEEKSLQYEKYRALWAATTSMTRTRLTGAEPM